MLPVKLWLRVSKGMLPVKDICSNKSSFCVSRISLRSQGCHKDEVNMATLCFGDITGCKTVVSANSATRYFVIYANYVMNVCLFFSIIYADFV